MNTKLLMTAVVMLFVAQGLSAVNEWVVFNHTPFSITVKYNMGAFGKDRTVTINPNDESKFPSAAGANLKGIDIRGIQALAGKNYFGGSDQATIIGEDLKGAKSGGMNWHVFAEQVIESQAGPGLTIAFTPTKVRFFLVRRSKALWPKNGGVIATSVWFNPASGSPVQ